MRCQLNRNHNSTGSSKINGAKFSGACSVRANWLCMGWPFCLAEMRRQFQTGGKIFFTTLYIMQSVKNCSSAVTSYPIPLLGADIICRWCLKLNVAAVAESSKFIALPSACSLAIYKIFPSQRSRFPPFQSSSLSGAMEGDVSLA